MASDRIPPVHLIHFYGNEPILVAIAPSRDCNGYGLVTLCVYAPDLELLLFLKNSPPLAGGWG
jgi:hypothetical protein